jgi:outer membrane receptor protein involved in Fe transport
MRMTSDWESVNGLSFSGPVDGVTIIDMGLGYKFNPNLQFSVNATNLFDTKFRAIYGAPDIRRTVLGRIIYDIR